MTYPLVRVIYADAWFDENASADVALWPNEWLVTAVGFLIRDEKRLLSIAQEIHPNGTFRAVTHIPRPMVRSVEIVKEEA